MTPSGSVGSKGMVLMSSPLTVLVVEDKVEDYDVVVERLQRSGIDARCRRVDTEEDYRAELKDEPDIILSDYVLPSFSALDALQMLGESGRDIPLIVITGVVSEEVVAESLNHGAADYLLKDRMTRLGPAVTRALQERDLRAESGVQASQEIVTAPAPLTVLVVEDQIADYDIMVQGLRRSGIDAQCRRVDTEEEYRTQLKAGPDIILSDYVLPSFGALDALQVLEDSGQDIPLIVITGMVSEETVVESMKHGAADYLLKDRMTRLGPAVRRAMQERDLRAEKKRAEGNATRDRFLREAAEARAAVSVELAQANHGLRESNRRLKETQAQLIQNEKMASLGQLVAGIAHEINNPLAFVLNNLFIVEEKMEGLSTEMERHLSEPSLKKLRKARTRLSEMRQGLDRVKELVLDLRTFSRLDEGRFKTVDIVQTIDAVLLLLKHKMTRRIKVEKHYDKARTLYCYAGRLHQVLMNLVANAVDAIAGDGTIVITTSQTDEAFLISVRDSGTGIPESIRSKIFDPFFTTKPVGQGNGLGLAISYGIVQDHRGTITVQSEEGVGTEFIVQIPLDLESRSVK
jgi:two-component system NtrC family sensor kinase